MENAKATVDGVSRTGRSRDGVDIIEVKIGLTFFNGDWTDIITGDVYPDHIEITSHEKLVKDHMETDDEDRLKQMMASAANKFVTEFDEEPTEFEVDI